MRWQRLVIVSFFGSKGIKLKHIHNRITGLFQPFHPCNQSIHLDEILNSKMNEVILFVKTQVKDILEISHLVSCLTHLKPDS